MENQKENQKENKKAKPKGKPKYVSVLEIGFWEGQNILVAISTQNRNLVMISAQKPGGHWAGTRRAAGMQWPGHRSNFTNY